MSTSIEGTHLGKKSPFPKKYSPELVVAVPRIENRVQYNLHADQLPFEGVDVWHAWEVGFLTDNGLPIVGVLKLIYPCTSEFLVESKSLKLYLNSFNMEKLGPSRETAIQKFLTRVEEVLCQRLDTQVTAAFFESLSPAPNDFEDFELMDHHPAVKEALFVEHEEAPQLLTENAPPLTDQNRSQKKRLKVSSHLLRSNCKITHQPDWGSIFITMEGTQIPAIDALMKYLVSFRNEHHFHEEVCEMIFTRLWDIFSPESLGVSCIYTRRGGIDICPVRVSSADLLPVHLTNPKLLTQRLLRQ